MKHRYRLRAAFAAVGLVAVATACGGGMNLGPSVVGNAPAALESAPIADTLGRLGLPLPAAGIPPCTTPLGQVPGTYISYLANGNVKGTTFTAVKAKSYYFVERYARATPPPSPTPTSSPTTGPTPPPTYFYYGTYTLKKGLGGCAYLIATVSRKPFKASKFNALSTGAPRIHAKWYKTTFVSYGPMTMTVTGLSASGGSGSFVLLTPAGKTYNTGTVRFTGRVTYP